MIEMTERKARWTVMAKKLERSSQIKNGGEL